MLIFNFPSVDLNIRSNFSLFLSAIATKIVFEYLEATYMGSGRPNTRKCYTI